MRRRLVHYGTGGMSFSEHSGWDSPVRDYDYICYPGSEPSVEIEDSADEPSLPMVDEERTSDFGLQTERGREILRSTQVSYGNEDNAMRHKTPFAPVASPLSVADVDNTEEHKATETTQETQRIPMTAEENYTRAAEVTSRVGGKEQETSRAEAATTLASLKVSEANATEQDVFAEAGHASQTSMHTVAAATSSEKDASGPMSPAASDKVTEPQPPLLADEVVESVANTARKQFKEGDVAAISDPNDLSKALLIPSDRLDRRSNMLSTAGLAREQKGPSGLCCLFVLDLKHTIPSLRSLDLTSTREDLQEPRLKADTPVVSKKVTRSQTLAKIKTEGDDGAATLASTENDKAAVRATTWTTAYRMLFQMLDGSVSRRRVFTPDAREATDHIQNVIAIANRNGALKALKDVFHECLLGWIGNGTLYPAIKEKPASWLDIGIALENENTFKEAFIRCVGRLHSFSDHEGAAKVLEICPSIEEKVRALDAQRGTIDYELHNLMLAAEDLAAACRPAKVFVSTKRDPVAWLVNSLFADWMREHLTYLNDDGRRINRPGAQPESNDIRATATCDHNVHTKTEPKACLTDGGFYRLVAKGGDAYLPEEKVLELLQTFRASFPGDQTFDERVGNALRALKHTAKSFAQPLAVLQLAYANEDEREYLTCVEVEEKDYPWEVKSNDEEDDEMEW